MTFPLKTSILAILIVCAIQTTRALKCHCCLYAPDVPFLNLFSDDASCEDPKAIGRKFIKTCKNPDDICATFSIRFNAILPNVIKRLCAPRSFKKDNKSCYNGTLDKFTAVIPELNWLRSKVEVCTCDTDNCMASNSNEHSVNLVEVQNPVNQITPTFSNSLDSAERVSSTKGLQCYDCAYTTLPIKLPDITFDKSCDIGQTPNPAFLRDCQNRSCVIASNYETSKGIKFVYRTCIDLNLDKDHKCRNYTKDQLKMFIQNPLIGFLNSDVEVCGCRANGCNGIEESSQQIFKTPASNVDVSAVSEDNVQSSVDLITTDAANIVSSTEIVGFTKGLQCYECAYAELPIKLPSISLDKSCDIGQTPNSTYLKDCHNRTCIVASNYKTSKGIKFVYRTCIELIFDNDQKCRNYTKDQLKMFIKNPLIGFLDSDVEVCGCREDGCNSVEESLAVLSIKPQMMFHNKNISTNSVLALSRSASLVLPREAFYNVFALFISLALCFVHLIKTTV